MITIIIIVNDVVLNNLFKFRCLQNKNKRSFLATLVLM